LVSKAIPDTGKEREKAGLTLPADLIRTVGIVLVILLHASIENYSGLTPSASESMVYWTSSTFYDSIARPCVPLFVMLSGALLLQPSKTHEPIRVFLKKRFSRIGLAFGFWSVIYFAWRYFVYNETLSIGTVFEGIVTGPYYHFWFLYLIAGLYLATPILRIVVGYSERKILRYFIILWLLGASVVPLFGLITGLSVNGFLFVISGWLGYFILGVYLQKVHIRSSALIGLLILGYVGTMFGALMMSYAFNYLSQYYFFFDSLTINVIAASVALFLLLSRFSPNWPGSNHPQLGKLIKAISANTLSIYLLQLIVLEAFQKGFFGVKISLLTINPLIEIPLATMVTLFVTLGLVLVMKRVPVLRRLIG
jgi:surface polysaccharide O-acyltransferase-like enzyme